MKKYELTKKLNILVLLGPVSLPCGFSEVKAGDFMKAVKETHGNNQHAKEYMAVIELAKARIL